MTSFQKARTLYRDYFIDLEQPAGQNWHVISVTHTYNGSSLLPPGFNYPDRTTAEEYARAAIDGQLDW